MNMHKPDACHRGVCLAAKGLVGLDGGAVLVVRLSRTRISYLPCQFLPTGSLVGGFLVHIRVNGMGGSLSFKARMFISQPTLGVPAMYC
jgi:hypothetical protein